MITSIEKTEITVTPITQNTEEQKAKNADKQTEPEENLAEESTWGRGSYYGSRSGTADAGN